MSAEIEHNKSKMAAMESKMAAFDDNKIEDNSVSADSTPVLSKASTKLADSLDSVDQKPVLSSANDVTDGDREQLEESGIFEDSSMDGHFESKDEDTIEQVGSYERSDFFHPYS